MAMNYHMEARRRQRFMERVCEARKRLAAGAAAPDGNDQRLQCGMINSCTSQSDPVISTDQGQFYQSRWTLTPFRVNEEGYKNRYQNRQHLAPHCDKAYAILYPGSENSDYTCPETRKNRRENTYIDSYEISKRVNGQ
ncbi:uncharacterized protein LOC131950007 isoform X1 [Physella acuta]|uniref:uncharacterized protein LOC131950007 isoform X1 n=1 Tax=Physella acuta TaxID=109671 RepID=UPI0027DC4E14|nr:uncharacterized protein LOC131950007 isoform X1 [Physella acuta]XP_059167986.1 uncharacterized protein LOC131950007 isoform X1 [Physella acuta]